VSFVTKNNLVHFNMKTRIYKETKGVRDLVNELRNVANRIEANEDFTV